MFTTVSICVQEDSIVIPRSATVFVQLVHSDFLWDAHKLIPEKVRHILCICNIPTSAY